MKLLAETWVAKPVDAVFPFFADARNLQALTPDWLHFQIVTPPPVEMRPGALIEYRISLHGLPMSWLTEITDFAPPVRFVDKQLRGPYRSWIHTHRFVPRDGGTLMSDEVEYDMVGAWLVAPFIRRDLRKIFAHRHQALLAHFGQPKPWPPPTLVFS